MTKRLQLSASPDREKVVIEFLPDSGASGKMEMTQNDLLGLIQVLGKMHAHMREGKEIPPLEGLNVEGVFNTRWFVQPEMIGEAAGLSFYHTSFGPLGFLIPVDQLPILIRPLQQLVEAKQQEGGEVKN